MSEQSGPITREQVERAIAKPRNIDYRELPLWWREWAPDYVIAAEAADDWDAEHAALTRWRDELTAAEREHRDWLDHVQRLDEAACALRAAEPVRRVARWDDDAAPRFKVGDLDPALHETALAATRMWRRWGKWPLSLPRVGELPGFDAWNTGQLTTPDWIAQLEALLAEPASPPAPEVVDVPRPVVVAKRCGHVVATWRAGGDCVTVAGAYEVDVPLALLRAMLAAIDAQQGGASCP